MNTSTRRNDSIDKNNEHFSNAEDMVSKPKGISRILKPILITLLSILCLTGGIVLHKLHSVETKMNSKNSYGSYTASSSLSLLKENTSIPLDNPLNPLSTISTINNLSINEEENLTKSNKSEEIPQANLQDEILAQAPVLEPAVSEEANGPINPAKNISTLSFLDGFTLKDALEFKENFLAENNCKNNYQKLLNVPNKTPEALAVLNDLSPYCLNDQKPVLNVLEAFLENKKEAIIAYYKKNNPAWLAYLKAIPISLIEIRRINPQKDTPKNILYKAQNELLSQNVENAVNFVTKLPLEMQQKMDEFYREAAIYNRSLQSLDQLILSFERKGE